MKSTAMTMRQATCRRTASGKDHDSARTAGFSWHRCARLAQEVRVLFDPDNLASRLCPRPQALRQLIDLLNGEQLQEAWQPGNEETIGWVYQAFNAARFRAGVPRGPQLQRKSSSQDIPAATQMFTPRWVVRFLVENTLGSHVGGDAPGFSTGATAGIPCTD